MALKFIDYGLSQYSVALLDMQIAREGVVSGGDEYVFMTEHEAMYSSGRSFMGEDFLKTPHYPVYYPNRGGRVTVHSEGQIVVYPIINLAKRGMSISDYVKALEDWMIEILKMFQVDAHTSERGIGAWVGDAKIGFIGVQIRGGVSSHGLCLNVSNDLAMFECIIPCGIPGLSVTSLSEVAGRSIAMADVKAAFIQAVPIGLMYPHHPVARPSE
ncbi:MAG: lipoyl(octanoyl) transferase LipB [Holosporales bacterium]|jgi:lipoyl(octanoyl) transferase|nr:lipoyl(octanoyl) transferase LipB [Holosporales bacterium]